MRGDPAYSEDYIDTFMTIYGRSKKPTFITLGEFQEDGGDGHFTQKIFHQNEAGRQFMSPNNEPMETAFERLYTHLQGTSDHILWKRFLVAMNNPDDVAGNFTIYRPHPNQPEHALDPIVNLRHYHAHQVFHHRVHGKCYNNLTVTDITENINREYKDDLVKSCYKRSYFEICLSSLIKREHPFLITFYDLDGFKRTNHVLGHGTANEVLKEIGRRLEQFNQPGQLLARFGGDEFMVLTPYAGSAKDAVAEANTHRHNVSEVLSQPVTVRDQKRRQRLFRQTVSSGVLCVSPKRVSKFCVEKLYNESSRKMYLEKDAALSKLAA